MFENHQQNLKKIAIPFIQEEIKKIRSSKDPDNQLRYIKGLLDMAEKLDIISNDNSFVTYLLANRICDEMKAQDPPVRLDSWLYLYKGLHIIKRHRFSDYANEDLWDIKDLKNETIMHSLTLNDAIAAIDKLAEKTKKDV